MASKNKIKLDDDSLCVLCGFMSHTFNEVVNTRFIKRELEKILTEYEKYLVNEGKYFEVFPIVQLIKCKSLSEEYIFTSTDEMVADYDMGWFLTYPAKKGCSPNNMEEKRYLENDFEEWKFNSDEPDKEILNQKIFLTVF